ncbi:MAG: signal peptidase I [Pyramidobacter sp.]|nr:signal peptidase I [Pyramidobacter sp.]
MALKDWWERLIAPAARTWEKLVPIAWLRESVETIVWAVVLALLLKTFVIQAFWIPSGSMLPTLLEGDRVLVCKFEYLLREPRRGDIFVFKYPKDTKIDYVKRLIALPGDTFEIRQGTVWINGEKVKEPYVRFRDTYTLDPVTVPEDSYVALGDNRPNSADSRFWGYVPKENIRGPVLLRYWPLNRIGLVR